MLSAHGRNIRKLGLALLGIGIVGLLILTVGPTSPKSFGPIIVPSRPEPGKAFSPPAATQRADAAQADLRGLLPTREPDSADASTAADTGPAGGPSGGIVDQVGGSDGDRAANDGPASAQPPENDRNGDETVTPTAALPSSSREDGAGDDDDSAPAGEDDDDSAPAGEDDDDSAPAGEDE
ncbi:MAG: hypothetical protein ACRDTT_22850 [Pseudonocardiaceae bacterium]